jgi:hypothetical protein
MPRKPTSKSSASKGSITPKEQSRWRDEYARLRDRHYARTYPSVAAAGLIPKPTFPDTNKANGLTKFVIDMINWSGGYANRISSSGRVVNGKYIPGATRKGTADIHAIIKGMHFSIEIKVGRDRMSNWQEAERERVRNAGGNYLIVADPDSFCTALEYIISAK